MPELEMALEDASDSVPLLPTVRLALPSSRVLFALLTEPVAFTPNTFVPPLLYTVRAPPLTVITPVPSSRMFEYDRSPVVELAERQYLPVSVFSS